MGSLDSGRVTVAEAVTGRALDTSTGAQDRAWDTLPLVNVGCRLASSLGGGERTEV